ncbi:hypothetical protein BGW80DRAFT_1444627, partial [Lactifluus volemus]
MFSDSSSSMHVRTSEPTFSAADTTKGHGVNFRDPPPLPSRSLAARQSQGGPAAREEPSSSIREGSQTPSPPARIEHRSRAGASQLESMRPEAARSDESEGQTGGGGQQGGNNMPREIRPVTAGRDMPIDAEPPLTAPMQLASRSRSGMPKEGGGPRDVAESSRRGLPRASSTPETGMQSSEHRNKSTSQNPLSMSEPPERGAPRGADFQTEAELTCGCCPFMPRWFRSCLSCTFKFRTSSSSHERAVQRFAGAGRGKGS